MRLRLVSLIVITLALTLPATASAELTWSGPIALDHNGATSLIAVACATTTQCTAVDQIGQQVTFSPASGGGRPRARPRRTAHLPPSPARRHISAPR
jgi:hypothetical protein